MRLATLSLAASLGVALSGAARAEVVALPDINIVVENPATPPSVGGLGGGGNFFDSAPSNNTRIDAATIARTASPDVADTLKRVVPSVDIQETSGNSFQPDVVFRGFVSSPISGTPQGLAVYQNGVRINESFGDTMNWDMIPTFAIAGMDMITNNPAFGLNALGGALNIRMKDGFTFSGGKLDVSGGSFGRIQAGLEYGEQSGNFALYGALEAAHDNGFRDFGSSTIRRFYGDLGYRIEGNEIHLSLGLADNLFGASGPAPIQLLQEDWSNVYTTPQSAHNEMGMVTLSGKFQLSPSWSLNGSTYVRRYVQSATDGNPTNVQPCANSSLLCFNDNVTPANGLNGQQLPNNFPANAVLGEIDRTGILTTSAGASVQLSDNEKWFGHTNTLSFGASFDYGTTTFGASAELGTVSPNYVIAGSGIYLGPSGNPVSDGPVDVHSINRYFGVNALDAFEISDKLVVTGGARLNVASISLEDELGGGVTGNDLYVHVNPIIGLTYQITPALQGYASFAQSNRAPTPLELGCANPQQPCILATFLVSDPPLKQVVASTAEAGLRGQNDLPEDWGSLGWKLGVFHTVSTNDIMNIPDPFQQGFGYFANVGDTLREGVEAQINYKKGPVTVHASYAYINATFLDAITLASNSPSADANGLIYVRPGDQIPLIPRNRAKLGADWDIDAKTRVGADLLFTGPERFQGDSSNQQPLLPAYFTVSLNGSYKITNEVEFYGRVENLLNRRYYTYGTYFDTQQLFQAFNNPQSVSPAQPLSVYAGLRVKF
ncbi:TonB-dependent receptor [Rhodoblastus sp.]|uniref:TonB-dependent receptor n=1 Tax=Rhodoblastus sp. TaxID=1962975 RepID=UPI003F989FAB